MPHFNNMITALFTGKYLEPFFSISYSFSLVRELSVRKRLEFVFSPSFFVFPCNCVNCFHKSQKLRPCQRVRLEGLVLRLVQACVAAEIASIAASCAFVCSGPYGIP